MTLLLFISCLALGAAIFFFVWVNYDDVERKTRLMVGDYADHIYSQLERMFLKQPLHYCYAAILISTGVFALVGLLFVVRVVGPIWALGASIVFGYLGYKVPGWIVDAMFVRRVQQFDNQLVDILAMMSNSLKAGLSFMQVLDVLEKEMRSPAKEEFRLVLQENKLGVTIDDALVNLSKRIPSEDLYMVVSSIVTLRETGGNLSETFETIATVIRERVRIKGKIRTMTAQGVFSAIFLCVFPYAFLAVTYGINPESVGLMWTTPVGLILLLIMTAFVATAAFAMRRILTIDV